MLVEKRDGSIVGFDGQKIRNAILKAFNEAAPDDESAEKVATQIAEDIAAIDVDTYKVEEIQDEVEKRLMNRRKYNVARAYMNYRYLHSIARSQYNNIMQAIEEKLTASNVVNQNANVDEKSFGGRLGEAMGVVAKKFALERCISKMGRENHEKNMVYIHDLDAYAVGSHNCLSIPFDKLLSDGFNTRQADIRPAQSINTAFQLIAVIFQLQSLQQFGGVSATHIDWTMVPYVRKSFAKHFLDGIKWVDGKTCDYTKEKLYEYPIDSEIYKKNSKAYEYAVEMTERETLQAVEAMYHNLFIWATRQ